MKPIDALRLPQVDATLRFQASLNATRLQAPKARKGPVITLSREFGCEGNATGAALQGLLETGGQPWIVFSRGLHEQLASERDPVLELREMLDEHGRGAIEELVDHLFADKPTDYIRFKTLAHSIHVLGSLGHSIIIGSAGVLLLRDASNAFHVRIIGSEAFRTRRIADAYGITADEAREEIRRQNENRVAFVQKFMHGDIRDPHHYDLLLNNDRFSADEMAPLIIDAMNRKGIL
jgi:cytidylate kinase